jgi:ACS family glucarate transporter-like MFS transporter
MDGTRIDKKDGIMTGPPTRARYWVIFYAVTLAILSYINRVCISQAAPEIVRDLKLDDVQMGKIFGAFALSYALFEIPSGWLGDVIGPRKVLMRIVLWWSAFTAFTGAMWSFTSMWLARFLFGAGEAGCFPNLTKAFTTWLPAVERVRAQGIMWTFARWGGAFTPILVVWALRFVSWRSAFALFGALGVVWAFFFYRWYRDDPRDQKSVNAAELELLGSSVSLASGHGNVPWKKMLTSRSVLLLWLQYACLSFPWYFNITWLPTYLQQHWKLGQAESARLAILPLFLGGLGSLFCGWISAGFARRAGIARSRRVLACSGFLGAATFLALAIQLNNPNWVMLSMGLAGFCNDLAMPPSWAAAMDIGGRYAGTVAGSMNMMGNLAGFACPVIGGYILQATGRNWNLLLYIMAAVYLLGPLIWPFIDTETPLEDTA